MTTDKRVFCGRSGADIGIRISGIRAGVSDRADITADCSERDFVFARHQSDKLVGSVVDAVVGSRLHRTGVVTGSKGSVQTSARQRDLHAVETRFAKILLTVAVGIDPGEVAD